MRIVVVEDEALIRKGLANMIPILHPGDEVIGTAEDGLVGLELINQLQPDLIIMDIQMPQMDGLTMLSKLRKAGCQAKAVVLTAYSDFSYAKQAIELGIENYLLKPIKVPELKKTLEIIQDSITLEKGQEELLSLERIFRSSILEELPIDEKLGQVTQEKFGLNICEPLVLFSVWLGDDYKSSVSTVSDVLEECASRSKRYCCCVVQSERHCLVLGILYQIENMLWIQKHFTDSIIPVLERELSCHPVFTWAECDGIAQAPQGFAQMQKQMAWNLNFPQGTLVSKEMIDQLTLVPLKYPIDLENQLSQAVLNQDKRGLEQSIRQFFHLCAREAHHPDDIREACIRCCLSIINLGKSAGNHKVPPLTQVVFQRVSQAYTWEKIADIIDELYHQVTVTTQESQDVSLLVKRAQLIVEEYYNQGITLEETAQKLCVSEEYLSTQFKKETGASFTETVRNYRIEKVKELLLHSNLKLNQIANMVGYSDPKYMSRVFKDEVGMLPAEYRKSYI